MAFTDLDEHLAEAFGSYVADWRDGFSIVDRRPDKEQRTPEGAERHRLMGLARKHEAAKARHLAAMEAGVHPSTCCAHGCHHLLPMEPTVGGPAMYCRDACKSREWRRRKALHVALTGSKL